MLKHLGELSVLTQSTGTGTSAGQVSQSPITESQPKSSSSATDQSSSGSGESQEGQSTTSTNPVTSGSGSGTEGTVVPKSVEPTKVTLDINSSQSTSQFDYTKSDKINTFRVKDGHVFSKVTKGSTDIWEFKDNDCGTKVIFIDENKKYVSILLQNGGFIFYILSDDGTWKDITSTRHDIDRLKFFGDSDNPLTKNDYDVTIADYSYRFTFKAGVNCKKIKYADDELWKPSDDPDFAEITAFDLGLVSNSFFVKNRSKFKKLDFNPTQAKGGQSTTPVSEVVTATSVQQTSLTIISEPAPEKASVTVLAPTGRPRPKKTPEVSTDNRTAITLNIAEKASNSAIDFKEDYQKNVMVFSSKEKYVFNKIIKTGGSECCDSKCCDSETVIWEANDQTKYFDKVYVDGLGTFSKTKNMSLHLCNGNFIHLNGSDSGPWSEYPGVIDLDVRISKSNIKVDYFQKDNYRIYVAKPGYTIRKVFKSKKCGSECCCSGLVIWEAQGEHALKVVLMGSKKEPKHLAVLMNNGELTLLSKSGKGQPWQDVTSTKNKITDLKMYAMADSKTVELHKGHYSITLFNEFYGYLFYDGIGCVKVTHKGKNIWDLREEGDFGCLKGVFLDLKSNKFNVMNDDDRCWVCEEVRKVNPVTLDISSKASTDDFDYTVDHNRKINIYTSKGNAMFYQVIKTSSTNCCGSRCCGSETVIWEASDPQNYASKVFADGVGACSSTKNVSIYLLNGEILHFNEGDNVWQKSDDKIILDVDKTSSTIGYDFVHHGETRTFTVKPGYLFKTVMLSSSLTWLVCGSSCCKSACLSDHIFWEAETEEECSTKVTVYGVKTTVTNINIFLKNNEVKHFHKADGKWVLETSIVLDIESNKDNDLFEYRSTRNFGHFNPKPNLTITKIVKKSLEIWTAKPKDHGLKAVLMGSGKDEKFMSILLQSGNFVLLRKCGKGECWEDITQEKSDFSDIKMYSLEEGTSKYHLLTGNDYDPIIFESRYGYEFKDSVKCVKITYNDNLLWSHTDDPEFGYLKGLYLDLPKDQFSVTNLKDQTKQLTKARIVLNIEKTQSSNRYFYLKDDDIHTYTPRSVYVFKKISDGTTLVWESKTDVLGRLVMSKIKDGVKYLAILLTNNMFKLFKLEDGKWTEITDTRHDVSKLKFFGENDTVLTSSDYKVSLVDLSYQCTFKSGGICKKIMYDDDDLWKHTDDPKFESIEKFHLNLISNNLFVKNYPEFKKLDYKPTTVTSAVSAPLTSVTKPAEPTGTPVAVDISKTKSTKQLDYFKDGDCEKYTPKDGFKFNKVTKGGTVIWETKDNVFSKLVRTKTKDDGKYLAILLTNNTFKLFKQESGKDKPWVDITSDRADVSRLRFFGESDTTLSQSEYEVTIVDYAYQFTFNSGVKCKKIKYADDDVWKHTDDPKFESIINLQLGLISNNFFVKNYPEFKKLEIKQTTETAAVITPVSVTKPAEPTKITLDIEKTETTSEFEYTDQNGVITYAAKDNHLFDKVSQGTKVVWESKTDVCGTLVRTKTSKSVKFLVVLLTNNMFTLFHLDGNEWKDITSDRHDITNLKFLGENDAEITSSDYTVTIVDLSYTFLFNTGVSCKKVKYGDDEVWNHTDDTKFADIKSFSLGLASNSFFVKNQSDEVKKIEEKAEAEAKAAEAKTEEPEPTSVTEAQEDEGEAETKPVTPPAPTPETTPAEPTVTAVALDIEKTQSTSEFDYSDQNGIVTYSVKSGHGFNKVTKGTIVIWESTDLYGTLVRTKVFSNNERFLAIIFYNNAFKLFRQSEEDKRWEDITEKRHDVTKLKFLSHSDREFTNVDFTVSFVDFFYTYKFNDGVKCKKIMLGEGELWTHAEDPEFSEIKSLSLDLPINKFYVTNLKDKTKELTMPNIIIDSLDIKTSQTTTGFDYSRISDFHKCTPKFGYVFSKVAYDNTVIWESKDNLYGTQVMFIEGVKYLAILMTNNVFKLFEHHNDKWHETTSKRHDVTKVKFFGDNDTPLSSSDYNVSFVDFFYRLKFNTGVKCRKIKLGDEELWKHTDDPKFSEIILFSLGLASNNFFVKSMAGHCKKLPEPAVPTSTTEAEESTDPAQPAQPAGQPAESAETSTSAQPAESNQPEEHDSSEHSTPPTSSASSS
ncbi:SfiI-subtelomeric fragment related protein family member, putative [Theileria annulata]|uniref:SfiI-subtelomeric related protein family member, putative n=1 Tax=Theileria annulata TaxID=5874 RepID=Q4UHH0_THEAN|nr:SfiI-subtelomeric fragment related protein family member, putative [Theileria annulata]CAI73469.1 SfiI-subtelomeric fragment related protein family member, putative [Theileria annulata]